VYADPLLDLVTRYDASRVQIGYVRLSDGVTPIESYLRVGEVEADPLVIDPATGEVLVLDHAAPWYVMLRAARSGAQFLDALLAVAQFPPAGAASGANEARACAERCTAAAGGTEFRAFWAGLFWDDV
jgi:hypothetical protein